MTNYIVLYWWYSISSYSIYNLEKLYNIKNIITDTNSLHIYQASCLFIFACMIRSIFPRKDGQRICLFDTWLSYPLTGRILATIGEISFGYQLTLITKLFAKKLNCYKIYYLMNYIMFLIFIAQIFCWYGVLFQNNLMHVIEESIWMISMVCIGFSYLYFNIFIKNIQTKQYFYIAFIISYIYMIFMILIDIPMYYNRYLKSNVIINRTLYDSIKDMALCYISSDTLDIWEYNIWADEIPWMTGYFIGATYLSINLNHFKNLLIN